MAADKKRLEGRVAIVTGAGQGIGEAIASAYAGEGAKVIITGRTVSKLQEVARKISANGGVVRCLEARAGNRDVVLGLQEVGQPAQNFLPFYSACASKPVAIPLVLWGDRNRQRKLQCGLFFQRSVCGDEFQESR